VPRCGVLLSLERGRGRYFRRGPFLLLKRPVIKGLKRVGKNRVHKSAILFYLDGQPNWNGPEGEGGGCFDLFSKTSKIGGGDVVRALN